MMDFRLGQFPSSSVLYVYSTRQSIWFNPPYQRQSDVWSQSKRQLLLDSILNGFDVPKLYFHEFFPPQSHDGVLHTYAIVDGKQRLQSVFSFLEGDFPLSDDFTLFSDPTRQLAGLTYQELARQHPDLKARLDGFVLPIVTIRTTDTDLIEEMFSRLNEASPLNAAEKRNAFGTPLAAEIREVAKHSFFTERLPFDNKRYRHYELATKFLYLESAGKLRETKKIHLDGFVRQTPKQDVECISINCTSILDFLSRVFVKEDPLLRTQGMVVLYYFLFREALRCKWTNAPTRSDLLNFDSERVYNRRRAEVDEGGADYALLEFDRLAQSLNDASALNFRYAVLRRHVGPSVGRPPVPGE